MNMQKIVSQLTHNGKLTFLYILLFANLGFVPMPQHPKLYPCFYHKKFTFAKEMCLTNVS